MEIKICKKCGIEKPLCEFSVRKEGKDGHRNECKECVKDYHKQYAAIYYLNNKEQIDKRNSQYNKTEKCKEHKKEYYDKNKDVINEKAREKYIENKEIINKKHKEYREQNKDKESLRKKLFSINNPEKLKEQRRKYYIKNKDKIKEYTKRYISEHRESDRETKRIYREANKEKMKEWYKEYCIKNKEKRSNKRKENAVKINEYKRNYDKKRKENDILYKLRYNMRSLIRNSLNPSGFSKKLKTEEILGCSCDEFKHYLESKFEPWMNWENHGKYKSGEVNYGWDIDHIIPSSSAKTEEEIIKLNHYTNLQPLCSYTNRYIKRDKIM